MAKLIQLPLIHVFEQPYKVWLRRETTVEERVEFIKNKCPILLHINEELIKSISTHFNAAQHIIEVGTDNGLEGHVDQQLDKSTELRIWQQYMPTITPEALLDYKNNHAEYHREKVDEAINKTGCILSEGQILFHGGCFNDLEVSTNKPLSTTLCPQIALRNAEWCGKAYDCGRIDIYILTVSSPIINVFFFNIEENLGNEKEVLFASGVRLHVIRRTKIKDAHHVGKITSTLQELEKEVPVYIVECTIS